MASKSYKRLVVLSDGTWETPESRNLTNVVQLARAIKREDADGIQQVVMYDEGLGTSGSMKDYYLGGYFGEGIDINIKQLYTFLSLNYDEGDEVYLIGYSRGSYTIRSLCGMIYTCGLVRRKSIEFIQEAFDLYRKRQETEDESKQEEQSHALNEFKQTHGDRIPIKLLACFDTVSALGIPRDVFGISVPNALNKKYQFHDAHINEDIQNAIHLLSIDEDRAAYSPTLMKPSKSENQLIQLFFWGTHNGVDGGKYYERLASDTTLRFLVNEMNRRHCNLAIEEEQIPDYPSESPDTVVESNSNANKMERFVAGTSYRDIPSVDKIHWTAIRRYQLVPTWRPKALDKFQDELMQLDWEELKTKQS